MTDDRPSAPAEEPAALGARDVSARDVSARDVSARDVSGRGGGTAGRLAGPDDGVVSGGAHLADQPRRVRRLWGSRRLPTALLALVVLAAAGTLLTLVILTRTGSHPFPDLQHRISRGLRHRTWDDVWVRIACAVAVVAGLVLLACGLIRGRARMLPLGRRAGLIAYIHRRAVEAMITDTAEHTRGVGAVNVNVHPRRHVLVLASARYRDVDEVEDELDRELTSRLDRVGLDRPVPLRVRMDRERRRVR